MQSAVYLQQDNKETQLDHVQFKTLNMHKMLILSYRIFLEIDFEADHEKVLCSDVCVRKYQICNKTDKNAIISPPILLAKAPTSQTQVGYL